MNSPRPIKDWLDDWQEMLRARKYGAVGEAKVGEMLAAQGFDVQVTPPNYEEIYNRDGEEVLRATERHRDVPDMLCNGLVIEVKRRSEVFTGPDDYPFSTVYIDTVRAYKRKANKPFMHMNISEQTDAVIALPSGFGEYWREWHSFNPARRLRTHNYVCHKRFWVTFEKACEIIRKHTDK